MKNITIFKLIGNLIIITILDIALLVGSYGLIQKFEFISFAILLATLGIGIKVVSDTLKVINQLKNEYNYKKYSKEILNLNEDYNDWDDNSENGCFYDDDDDDDDDGCFYSDDCGGDCGEDCCSVKGGTCCKDKE
jgi:hypothetical protein